MKYLKLPSGMAHCVIWKVGHTIKGIYPIVTKICLNVSSASKNIFDLVIFEGEFSPQNPQNRCTFLWVTR